MSGKELRISSNDLYGNVDDRIVRVYACFEHSKYMNNYIVFSFGTDNNKLCYGSVHLKENSLVIFSVKNDVEKYILEFTNQYINDKLDDFKIISLNNINKVELVSYNETEFDKLLLLDEKAIPKVIVKEEVKESKPVFLYLVVFVLILLALGLTLLYFKPELFAIKYKGLECTNKLYDNEMTLYYDIEKTIMFDKDDKVEKIDVVRIYNFLDNGSYLEFKNRDDHNKYFNNGEGYKYIDEEFKFKVFYKEDSVIDDYDEMLTYLKREGFSCVEREYER